MQRKAIRLQKKRIVKNIQHISGIVVYLDNSVITKLRLSPKQGGSSKRSSKKDRKEIKFFSLSFVKKYNIKNIILTDKLFLEIIGHGQLRVDISKENRGLIHTEKQKIKNKIVNGQPILQEDIQEYYDFLRNFFSTSIKIKLPQKNIYSAALEDLTKYPFHKAFHALIQNRVLEYAKNISISSQTYDKFIDTLVNDSIIRYLLDAINLKEVPLKHKPLVSNFITDVGSFIMLKYGAKDLFHKDFLLLIAGLVFCEQGLLDQNKKSKRVLRLEDDFADSEMQHFVFYGQEMGGVLHPVTVISRESISVAARRLEYYYAGVVTLVRENPAYIDLLARNPREIVIGRSIVIDFEKFNHIEINLIPHVKYGLEMQRKYFAHKTYFPKPRNKFLKNKSTKYLH